MNNGLELFLLNFVIHIVETSQRNTMNVKVSNCISVLDSKGPQIEPRIDQKLFYVDFNL